MILNKWDRSLHAVCSVGMRRQERLSSITDVVSVAVTGLGSF